MTNKAIIGLQFGDEGKGITTDYHVSKSVYPLVIRYSGGQQAGHQVRVGDTRHIFSNFGSGTLRGADTYWSKFCTVDPIGMMNEYIVLLEKGILPTLYIDERCPVTTPYDAYHNQSVETVNQHGSCGIGVGATMGREEDFYSLTVGDLFTPSILKTKLQSIEKYYNHTNRISIDSFLRSVDHLMDSNHIQKCYGIPENGYTEHIFEGSQGLLLDQHYGFFPNVTRANVGTTNILELSDDIELYLVTRAYQTRHGNGFMTNEDIPHNIKKNEHETNLTNKYQGKFRRTILDLDLLEYAINKDEYIRFSKNKTLVITCLDHIKMERTVTYKGEIIHYESRTAMVRGIRDILGIKNVLVSNSDESNNFTKFG